MHRKKKVLEFEPVMFNKCVLKSYQSLSDTKKSFAEVLVLMYNFN